MKVFIRQLHVLAGKRCRRQHFKTTCKIRGRRTHNTNHLRQLHALHFHLNLFLNRGGPWDITDDFTTSFLHFCLFSTALWDLANSRLVHSLMLSSNLFFCLPCLLHVFCFRQLRVLAGKMCTRHQFKTI